MKSSIIVKFFSTAALVVGFTTAVHAQATRTWVSGVGDDVNPCSRTAPCKTFAGAISKTAVGGEISVLDPGGYGTVTITKAITIDGGTGAGWGSVLASNVNGIIVNVTTNLASDKVILRNLSINGGALPSLGINGIRFLDGAQLTVENCVIFNFATSGIDVSQTQASKLFVKNVSFSNCGVGIKTASSAGTVSGSLENVTIANSTTHGLQAISNTLLSVHDLVSSRNIGDGIRSEAASVNLIVENSTLLGNNFGANAVAGTIRLSNVGMYHNNTNCTTTVLSAGNNRSAGNTTTNTPTPGGFTIN